MGFATGLMTYVGATLVASTVTRKVDVVAVAVASAAVVFALVSALWIPPEHTLVRFLVAILGFVVAMRTVDLLRDRRRWSWRDRLWLFTAVVDVRNIEAMPPRRDPMRWWVVLAYAGLATLGWEIAHVDALGSLGWATRYAGGAMFIYGIADAACGLTVEAHAVRGLKVPPQHHAPILATSVGAFWSQHYNLNVSDWIGRHIHRPIARMGRRRWALAAAFAFSAAFHMWLAWVPLDVAMAASMAAFFLVQGAAVLLERTLSRWRHWPARLRRAWTLAWVLIPSPLFVEPFLRIIEGQFQAL
jgi:hypothetical protein